MYQHSLKKKKKYMLQDVNQVLSPLGIKFCSWGRQPLATHGTCIWLLKIFLTYLFAHFSYVAGLIMMMLIITVHVNRKRKKMNVQGYLPLLTPLTLLRENEQPAMVPLTLMWKYMPLRVMKVSCLCLFILSRCSI